MRFYGKHLTHKVHNMERAAVGFYHHTAATWIIGKSPSHINKGRGDAAVRWSYHFVLAAVLPIHNNDFMMSMTASQITHVSIVRSTICSGVDQRRHQSFSSLVFVRGIQLSHVNSPHKGPVTWKGFPHDDVIMKICCLLCYVNSCYIGGSFVIL